MYSSYRILAYTFDIAKTCHSIMVIALKLASMPFHLDLVPLRSSLINNVIHTTELKITSMKETLTRRQRSQKRRAPKRKNPKKSPEGRLNPN